jgi:phosphoesterase RecJ-like protein
VTEPTVCTPDGGVEQVATGDLLTEAAFRRVGRALEAAHSLVLTTHRDPDGDGLGAEAALADALRQLDKRVQVINADPVPRRYRFLTGSESFATYRAAAHRGRVLGADVVVLLDAARASRTGRLGPVLRGRRGTTVAIDHHLDRGEAPLELIDPSACATTELVHELLLRLPVRLTPGMAEALYAGLVVDTDHFRTPGTTPDAHRRAAALLEAGASVERVQEAVFGSWRLGRLRLQGQFLERLRTAAQGRLVWGVVDRPLLRRWRQTPADTEGLAEQALTLGGAELAILFLEEPDAVRVSLRSRGPVRVDGLARRLGGGGHERAAGTRLPAPMESAVPLVVREAKRLLPAPPAATPDRAP